MKISYKSVLLAMLSVIIFIGNSRAQQCGVLIGLKHEQQLSEPLPYGESGDAARQAMYRTLWIFSDNGDSMSITEISNILVPRANGFWKVQVNRQRAGNWVEDVILSAPFDRNPEMPSLDTLLTNHCEGNKRIALIFVWTDFLSFEGSSDGYCEGAAHPWHVNYLKTVSLDDPSTEGVEISEVLGFAARSALRQGAEKYFARTQDEKLNPEPDGKNWGLIRRRGQWILRGQLDYSAEVFRGHFAHFDIDFSPSKKLTGQDRPTQTWQQIKKLTPNARDAIIFPDRNLLITLSKDRLLIYSKNSDSNVKLIQKAVLLPDEFLIMAQWASGEQAEQWNAAIREFLNHESSNKMKDRFH